MLYVPVPTGSAPPAATLPNGYIAWLVIVTIIAILALFLGIFLPTAANDASNLHAIFTRQQLNITVLGVCGEYPVDMIFSKVGSKATIEVPSFICDGTVNGSTSGLFFTLPAGYDADVPFAESSAAILGPPFVGEYVNWCSNSAPPPPIGRKRDVTSNHQLALSQGLKREINVSRPSGGAGFRTSVVGCTNFSDTIAYIVGNIMFMGTSTETSLVLAGSNPYGPWYGFSITYYTTNGSTAAISAAMPSATPMSLAALLAGTVALGTMFA